MTSPLTAAAPVSARFAAAGYRLYLVGGVVRETVSGRATDGADLDCTTDARPAAVRAILAETATSLWTQGERFGTIGCVIDGQFFEITTHRAERYDRNSRKPVVAFGDDVVEDLARRDFTVNAMAIDTADGTLIDPHGGQQDLAAAILRTPLDPAISFGDDPLRMLRAARFIAGHGLTPDAALVAAVRAMGDRLQIVSAERIREELQKLLLLADPAPGFAFLAGTGLVEPALGELAGRDAEELGRLCAAVAGEPTARWASLFVHEPAAAVACLRRLRASTRLVSGVRGLLEGRTRLGTAGTQAPDVRRLVSDCPVPVDDVLAFTRAVETASGRSVARLDEFAAALAELRRREDIDCPVLPIDGGDVMDILGIDAGPLVGRALAMLRERSFENGPLSRDAATSAVQRWQAAGYCAEQ